LIGILTEADISAHAANSLYKHFLRAGAENADAQISALQTSGYATDPMYVQKIKNIMKGLPDEEGQG
jgi:flagellum-specific peptidoglycan hydrolase FlgJ